MSTIEQWRREVEGRTFMNCVVFHGTEEARNLIRKHEFHYTDSRGRRVGGSGLYKFHVLITTFEMVLKETFLGNIDWQYMVIDEGHRIKSKKTKLFQQLFQYNAQHKLILTGTPMQNHIEVPSPSSFEGLNHPVFGVGLEADVARGTRRNCGPCSTSSTRRSSMMSTSSSRSTAISRPRSRWTSSRPRSGPTCFGTPLPYMSCSISASRPAHNQIIIITNQRRRMKEDVDKTIPLKEETIVEVELTSTQKKYYRAILDKNREFLYRGAKSNSNLPQLVRPSGRLSFCVLCRVCRLCCMP